jgi:hypothetical protein
MGQWRVGLFPVSIAFLSGLIGCRILDQYISQDRILATLLLVGARDQMASAFGPHTSTRPRFFPETSDLPYEMRKRQAALGMVKYLIPLVHTGF